MNIIATAKAHPFLTGGAVIVGIIVIMYLAGGSGTQTVNNGVYSAADDSQSAAINAQLSAQSQQIAAAREISLGQQATDYAMALLARDVAIGAQQIESQKVSAAQQNEALISTLSARVTSEQIAASVRAKEIESATSIETTKTYANALIAQTQVMAGVINKQTSCTGLKSLFGGC